MAKLYEEVVVWQGKEYLTEYFADPDFNSISPITQVQALATLSSGDFVIYQNKSGQYGLPGGSVEAGENLEQALAREIGEEIACKLVQSQPLLYLKITNPPGAEFPTTYQVRYWAEVETLDQEVSDPAGKSVKRLVVSEKGMHELLGWGRKLELYIQAAKERGLYNTNLTRLNT